MADGKRWQVTPDYEVEIGGEIVGVVSREAIGAAYMDAEAIQARMGGIVTCVVRRRRTGFEGEAVTVWAAFEWKPGVSARVRVEPEAEVPAPVPDQFEQVEPEDPDGAQALLDEPDPDLLGDEDENVIPASAR